MFDDFANPDTQLLVAIACFALLFVAIFVWLIRGYLRASRQERAKESACSQVQALAAELSFAHLTIGHEDCAEKYVASLAQSRERFREMVNAMRAWTAANVHDETQWRSLETTARVTAEIVRSNAAHAEEFLARCKIARQAMSEGELLLASYVPPENLSVDLEPARLQMQVATKFFKQHRFEDARRICARMNAVVEACEEASRLLIVIDEVSTKCGVDSWQAERAAAVKSQVPWLLSSFDAQPDTAIQIRDRFKLTRIKLLDYSNEPEPGTLLDDESQLTGGVTLEEGLDSNDSTQ